MLRNYLITAVRNLLRHRFFSAINVLGLAVAMSICMVLIMLLADQLSYDRYNTNADRIFRVTTLDVNEKGKVTRDEINAASPMTVGPELVEHYSGVEKAMRLRRGFGNGWIAFENQNVNIPLSGFFVDDGFLEMFEYKLQFGDPATALEGPYSVVLTRSASNKLFKEENPVGKTIKVGDLGTYTVTGVILETGNKSHIVFEGLASMASVRPLEEAGKLSKALDSWETAWVNWTYIRLVKGHSKEEIQTHLDSIFSRKVLTNNKPGAYRVRFALQSLTGITPGDRTNNSIGPTMLWVIVYFLGGLALVILLTSCFNFTNLSIARSLTRAREIGVRKVSGAGRRHILAQFLSEAVVVAIASLVLALLLLVFLKPMLLNLNFAQIFRWDLNADWTVYLLFGGFTLIVGIVAGFFPAVVLSSLKPVDVLKSLTGLRLFSRLGLRKVLLVAQFTLSILFIVTVLVMYSQLTLFMGKEYGFNKKNNILINLNGTDYLTLKTELQKQSGLTAISAVSHVPAAGTSHGVGVRKDPADPDGVGMGSFQVDEDYLKNMQLRLLAGSFFLPGPSSKNFVVVNESATRRLKYTRPQDAVGETLYFSSDSTTRTILGVVADYNHRDLTREISPLVLLYNPASFHQLQVAYVGSYANACAAIEKAWAAVNPDLKVDYKSVDGEIDQYYRFIFGDLVNVLGFISSLAIFISCLGLLGMATYTTETRFKEISIRKVLGASAGSVVKLLSRSFLAMLGIAILIGIPLAWFINDLWLSFIAYRTYMGPGIISLSILLVLLLGVLTIGSQTLRAAMVNPVDNLRSE